MKISCLTLMLITSAYAQIPLNPEKLLIVTIHCEGLTRTTLKDDSIQDIVVYPEHLSSRIMLHKSGQFFIDTKDLDEPLQVTLMTQRGVTQDIKFVCDSKCKKGPVILETASTLPKLLSVETKKENEKRNLLGPLVEKILKEQIEKGQSLPRRNSFYKGDLYWSADRFWEFSDYRIEKYTTKNKSSRIFPLKGEEYQAQSIVAVSFDKKVLEPNQRAVCVIVKQTKKAKKDD